MSNLLFTTVTIQLEDISLVKHAIHASPYEPTMILADEGIIGWHCFLSCQVQDLMSYLSNANLGSFLRAWD